MAKLLTHQKKYGSFYTPSNIASFIVNRVISFSNHKITTILEPSCGDGIFIEHLLNNEFFNNKKYTIDMVEINLDTAEKLKDKFSKIKHLNIFNKDFLDFQYLNNNKYHIIIGNPPYIKKNLLKKEQIILGQKIFENHSTLSPSSFKNIWSSFLVRAFEFLTEDGILAFVLPAELLQVDYAAELRKILVSNFSRVEVFTFNELLFKECKGQDTVILIAYKKSKNAGLFFSNIENIDQTTQTNNFTFTQHDIDEKKWSSHSLNSDELNLINKLLKDCISIGDTCTSKPGIVTAANSFFILNHENVEKYKLKKYIKPIVQKGSLVGEKIVFDDASFDALDLKNTPCYFIDLNNQNVLEDTDISPYLNLGLDQKLNERYKMLKRQHWFQVPYKAETPPLFFFKRCHNYPKLVRNYSKAITTDSAYLVFPNANYEADSILFSFYNSFTLACAELMGRYYGGGVLELTPSEFKKLPLPYTKISHDDFKNYLELHNQKNDIKEILYKYNSLILKRFFPKISNEEINILENIRLKLVQRRHRL